jgi:hypothetical protein
MEFVRGLFIVVLFLSFVSRGVFEIGDVLTNEKTFDRVFTESGDSARREKRSIKIDGSNPVGLDASVTKWANTLADLNPVHWDVFSNLAKKLD